MRVWNCRLGEKRMIRFLRLGYETKFRILEGKRKKPKQPTCKNTDVNKNARAVAGYKQSCKIQAKSTVLELW